MAIKVYGHPWSISTRKVLMVLAEKGREAELVLVMLPKGEHRSAEHLARHPFGKVPVLDDDGFVLYESRAIAAWLDRKLEGPSLTPSDARERARMDQWTGVADAYLAPTAGPLLVETLFRRYLGGEQNVEAMRAGREGMQAALDAADRWLGSSTHLAGVGFSLADIQWMPFVEYLMQTGHGGEIERRSHLAAWWARVSARPAWQRVARTGPQPWEPGMTADVIEKQHRR